MNKKNKSVNNKSRKERKEKRKNMEKEVLKDIKDYIKENKGITLDINTMKNTTKKSGFSVSLAGYETKEKSIDKTMEIVKEYIKAVKDLKKNNLFVGVWYDEKTSYYYIDISIIINKRREAERIAKENKQLAIYNLKDNESIYLNYNIKFYSIYKKIYNSDGVLINEMIETTKDTIKEVINYTKLSKMEISNIINKKVNNLKYDIFVDYIPINEYVKGL